MNLFANTVTYSDPAKAVLVVRFGLGTTDGRTLGVEDNGIGIPAAKRSQGLGLGLSIGRECMDAMGGTVAVESADGQGTTFVLAWPAAAWGS